MFKIEPRAKFELFKKTQRFCAVPWSLIYVWPNGDVKTCVAGKTILGNLNHNTIDEIINHEKLMHIKQNILQDQLVNNCSKCLSLENHGDDNEDYKFLRGNYNSLLQDLDVDYFDTNEFVLGALDLHWSSLCDLKCVTCHALQSSSIAQEQNLPIQHLSTEKANALIDWIIPRQHTLREVYLSGGEPTLIKHNLRLLEKLQKRPDLRIRINTNMMWSHDNQILQEVLKFPNVLFTCSADNLHRRFEYTRRGSTWQRFCENIKFLKNHPNVRLRINSVFCVLSAAKLVDTIGYFSSEFDIQDFTINQCEMGQSHLRSRNLPKITKIQCQQSLEHGIQKFSGNINLIGQFNNCIRELQEPATESYVAYLDQIDALSGNNWRSIFKELQCEEL